MLNYYTSCYCFVEFNNKYIQRECVTKRVFCSMLTLSGIRSDYGLNRSGIFQGLMYCSVT